MGIPDNYGNGREGFERALRKDFEEVETVVVGCVLVFKASRPIWSGD